MLIRKECSCLYRTNSII